MPKMIFTATTPDGRTVRRTSKSRIYQFVVIGRRNAARDLEISSSRDKVDTQNFHYYKASAEASVGDYLKGLRFPVSQDQKDRGQAAMDECGGDLDRHHEIRIAERVARLADLDAGFVALTWCGRRDLADKQVASFRSHHWLDVQAIPVLAG